MNSRSDKVSFLKGLVAGNRSISELAKATFEVFEQTEPGSATFKRVTKGITDNKEYTKPEIEQFKEAHLKAQLLVIMDSDACEPLLPDTDIIWREEKTYVA